MPRRGRLGMRRQFQSARGSNGSAGTPVFSGIAAGSITSSAASITWNVTPGSTGRVEYGTTIGYGSFSTLESNLLTAHGQNLSSLSSGTLYHYRVLGTSSSGQSATSGDNTFQTLPPSTGVYGPGMNIDSRANIRLGTPPPTGTGNADKISYRLRTTQNSAITQVQVVQRGGSGYSLPLTSKTWTTVCRIHPDDGTANHKPNTGVTLATSNTFSITQTGTFERMDPITFPGGGQYTPAVGELLHFVFDNTTASEGSNYYSLNQVFTYNSFTPRQPGHSNDLAILTSTDNGSNFTLQTSHTPIIEITYANGSFDGQGYNGVLSGSERTITGTNNKVRERFTVSGGDRTITSIYARVGRQSGTGLLTIRLETGAGTLIEEGTAADSGSSVALWTIGDYNNPNGTWVHRDLSQSRTLTSGQIYNIVLSCAAGTQYSMVPISHGILNPTETLSSQAFTDGNMQHTTNGSTYSNSSASVHANTQTYMVTSV